MAGMVVQHNMNALNAYNRLNTNVNGLKKSSEKLSSGYRINRAGDDAAGLAISEKMRSQIRGLNQAKRNSQDGISMIQTFEGALQETHSILQRMKELATESANGTYDNATDRAAIQLEFDQLNDELNQIADTDFNGVVVLNGGEMADGLEKVVDENGDMVFDYANKKDQVTAKVTQMLDDKIAAAQKELDDATAALDSTNYDLSENGTAVEWNSVDNNTYDKTEADAIWDELGITDTGAAGGNVVTDKISEIAVTYKFDGTNWVASKGIANDGTEWTEDDLSAINSLKATAAANGNATGNGATGEGGFTVAGSGADKVNAIFDATNAKEGDTVTLVFSNSEPATYAPTNIGFAADSVEIDNGTSTVAITDPTVEIGDIDDDEMTEEIEAGFKGLDGAKFEATYAGNAATAIKINGTAVADGDLITTDDGEFKIGIADGALTIKANDAAGTVLATVTINGKDSGTTGSLKFDLAVDAYNNEGTSAITVKAGDDADLGTSNVATAAKDAAAAKLAELTAQKDEVLGDWEKIKEYYGTADGVSISDAYDNSTAILTYKEDITLQVGSRSKDAVDFTFNYNKADMGDLEANLNVSAREGGLETANLSLSNQEDANYAIDQIDKAINKVSMVRATFGAMQNRLEHKIENITATSENLTEAESAIRDTDMASEMMSYTKFNILQQAAQSMLAQANQQPQGILQLLG